MEIAMQIAPLPHAHPESALRQKAREVETVFLAEMLRHGGLGSAPGPFGGGTGEEQFQSFLRHAQADAIVGAGGLGLAEPLFRAMTRGWE